MNRDQYGIIGQIQPDGGIEGGDSACWNGHYTYYTGDDPIDFVKTFEVSPGGYVRHPYPDATNNRFGAYYKNTKLYRGAFVLKKAEKGGVLRGTSEKLTSFFNGRVNFMRPDLTEHEVTVVEGNKTRWAMIATLFVDEPQEEE